MDWDAVPARVEGVIEKRVGRRRQGAKMFELRAATALAGLWQARSEDDAGRQMLEEILGWFTEGLDTPSLEKARALLS